MTDVTLMITLPGIETHAPAIMAASLE